MPGVRAVRTLSAVAVLLVVAATPPRVDGWQQASETAQECEAAVQASAWEEAVGHCEAAIRADPESFGIHYFLGFAHQATGAWAEAADSFDSFLAAVEARPGAAERMSEQVALAVRSAGIAHFRSGDRERALPLLQRSAEADPTDAEVSLWLGLGLLQAGDSEGAEASFSVVVREAPGIAQARFFLGQLRYDAGDYREAQIHLDEYLQTDPDGAFRADAHWMAGSIALRISGAAEAEADGATRDKAIRHFSALLQTEPDSPRAAVAHYFLGTVAADREDCETARHHYETFLRIAPNHERAPEVRQYLEESLGRCGELGPFPPR